MIEDDRELEEDDGLGFVTLENDLQIYDKLLAKLYPHQIAGVQWLYDLNKFGKRGGILADDMG